LQHLGSILLIFLGDCPYVEVVVELSGWFGGVAPRFGRGSDMLSL